MTHSATRAISEVSPSPSLYRAEQYDPDLGLYYLRARYYNPLTGRFLSRDPLAGDTVDPKTLHKYLYADGDPVNAVDPTGRGAIVNFVIRVAVSIWEAEITKKDVCIFFGALAGFLKIDAGFMSGDAGKTVNQLGNFSAILALAICNW